MRGIMLLLSLLIVNMLTAQQLLNSGKIIFEKRVNLLPVYRESGQLDVVGIQPPQYYTSYSQLLFSSGKTLYRPDRAGDIPAAGTWWSMASENIVYTDFSTGIVCAKKKIFESIFQIIDSVIDVDWKITSDTRIIGGVACRKATGVIQDSLVVIAFYSDRIPVSGGPESFSGLPGMIMGVAIPAIHTTWYAIAVQQVDERDIAIIKAPEGGSKVTRADLMKSLRPILSKMGVNLQRYVWQISL
jgi:GLPGLI family protein